ncbi:hypothetical protein [Streptomyces sp. Ru72]|uniref:hypothetical protein n=1 Tax=Streptomyces sp. Ru72 TaxID=2080747 RepID=UPI000CDDF5B8|nr:hypothetical protein [Streptomyces sp. Ru72]POX47116.1 hypothetical protein C3488_24520 [Streptomyces sp. Ru72]
MTEHRDDEEFYKRDRPAHPTLEEDRPRGGKAKAPAKYRGSWSMVAIIVVIVLLIVLGIALFP